MENLKKFKFDYENLAVEGGGVKLTAYVGALQVRERVRDKERESKGNEREGKRGRERVREGERMRV